ncbi:hypothetical protein AB0F91_42980 [Amycolatopsis sp. NPDC023774]|uniref:hypothetical protein n=1 Tax=Amycolatopsis sp. NPDC023774 TaxID=3155015 RepID=UPI0033CDC4BD
MKWANHPAGDARDAWSSTADARTLTLLVAGGPFRIDVDDESVVLCDFGDYVVFGPDQAHRWQALGEATAPAGFRP